jgi:alpha-1,6-mannosyltransferase
VRKVTGLDWPLTALAATLLALTGAGAIWVTTFDDPNAGLVALLQAPPYGLAAWLVVSRKEASTDDGRSVAAILLVALAMRLILLPGWPVSTDIFRYVWDGRVQGAGINPYLHVPADAALSSLRDSAIYPFINRADYAPTIYPPTAQAFFFLVTRISDSLVFMKAAMVALEAVAVWVILQLLVARKLPRSYVLLYAWHPLPLWEFAKSGHVDILAIVFVLSALLAAERRSPVLAGAALGAGALVKYIPVVTGPALYRRWDWRLPIAFIATAVVLYLPYIGAGTKVLGFLGRYVREESIEKGSGIFLWRLLGTVLPLSGEGFPFYVAAAILIMAALALYVVVRNARAAADIAGAMLLAVAFTILFSPHYAWYFAWLVPFLCFYPLIGVVYLTCAASFLSFAHWPPTTGESLAIYGPCLLLLIAELVSRRRQKLEQRHADAVPA